MSSWNNNDNAANSPLWGAATVGLAPTTTNQTAVFGNTTISAFQTGVETGVFGVDAAEAKAKGNGAHTGWVKRTKGTGALLSITANTGAYGSNGFITFTNGGTNSIQANATMVVNSANLVTAIVLNSGGLYDSAPTVAPPSGNAAFTLVLGGRAGRETQEVLVAMNTIVGDASDDSTYPDA